MANNASALGRRLGHDGYGSTAAASAYDNVVCAFYGCSINYFGTGKGRERKKERYINIF
jgi:hypothetical protein